MRTVATCQKALDLMCERVLSRETQGSLLARKEFMQGDIADSYAELAQFRLLVLYTAWEIDQYKDYRRTRKNIAAIKALTPKVVHDAVWRSMHAHGALGVSNEMPFGGMWMMAPIMSVVDGPTEVHKVTVAREVLKDYEPAPGLWPTAHLPAQREAARAEAGRLPRARRRQLLSAGHAAARCLDYGPPSSVVVVDVPDRCRRRAGGGGRGRRRRQLPRRRCWWPTSTRSTCRVPFTPGSEFAGTVRPVGPGVEGLAVGDRVMGA